MTISKVLILIIGQNNTNPKLLQPIVTSICKVLAVKKFCVKKMDRHFNKERDKRSNKQTDRQKDGQTFEQTN